MSTQTKAAEKMLGLEFISDPTKSKFPVPDPPPGTPEGQQYSVSNFVMSREMITDWLSYRVIVPERIPRQMRHEGIDPNRKIRDSRIEYWSAMFRGNHPEGEVYIPENPQGIVLSWDGFILDGQHRIAGAYNTGMDEFPCVADFNAPWSVLRVMDTPLSRTAGQMVTVPNPTLVTSAVRMLMPAILGTETRDYTTRGYMHEIVRITESWPFLRNPEWSNKVRKLGADGMPTGALGSVVYGALAAGADVYDVHAFLAGLVAFSAEAPVTIGAEGKDPRRLLARKYFRVEKDKRAHARMIAAMNFRMGMASWLSRHDDNPLEMKALPATPRKGNSLPMFWESEKIREYYRTQKENIQK